MRKSATTLLFRTFSVVLFAFLLASCNNFGKEVKIKKSSVYYKDISEAEAKKVGDYLSNIGYFTDDNDISIQLSKPKDSLELRFVVDAEKIKPEFDEQYLLIVSDISDSVFNKAPIIVYLADTDMKVLKRVGVSIANAKSKNATNEADVEAILKRTEQVAAGMGSNLKESKGNKLYYDNNVESAKIDALVEYLTDGGYFAEESGHIAVLVKKNNSYILKEAFTEQQIESKETTDALEEIAASIKQSLFNNDSFSFEVCNLNFEPQLSFMPGAK